MEDARHRAANFRFWCLSVSAAPLLWGDPRVALKGADKIADIVETAVKSRLGDGPALEKLFGKRDATAVDVFRGRLSRAFLEKLYNVKALVVGPGIKTGIGIHCDNPASVGADLICACVAAHYLHGSPSLIIDMGTATTISVVDKNKNYLGGLIMTGMGVAADALINRTAQLPKIDFEMPPNIIGRNTIDCMKSGALFSNACAIDGIIERIEEELGEPCTAVATGGLASTVIPLCKKTVHVDNNLLIRGLTIIYRKNKK
mgnify:CR=1 FL=1